MCNAIKDGGARCDRHSLQLENVRFTDYPEYVQRVRQGGKEPLSREEFAERQESAYQKLTARARDIALTSEERGALKLTAEERSTIYRPQQKERSYRAPSVKVWLSAEVLEELRAEQAVNLETGEMLNAPALPFLSTGSKEGFWHHILRDEQSERGNVRQGYREFVASMPSPIGGTMGRRGKGANVVSWSAPKASEQQWQALKALAAIEHRTVSEVVEARLRGMPLSWFPYQMSKKRAEERVAALG